MKKHELSPLRVKIKSLAAEARIIKAEVRRHKEYRRAQLDRNPDGNYNAALSAIPPLQEHRIGIVRSTARRSHLAYGCLRGVPYADMEAYCRPGNEPVWAHVKKDAQRFRGYRSYAPDEEIDAWIEEAQASLKASREHRRLAELAVDSLIASLSA